MSNVAMAYHGMFFINRTNISRTTLDIAALFKQQPHFFAKWNWLLGDLRGFFHHLSPKRASFIFGSHKL